MRLRTLILILVAAGCGLVAAVLVSQHLGGSGGQAAAAPAEKIKVLYAKVTVPGLVRIEEPEKFFEVREVSREEVRDGIGDLEKVKGRVLRLPLGKGKPLAEPDLFGLNENAGITTTLKEGERPVTLKVSPLLGTAGFIRPGDFVDVIATARLPGSTGVKAVPVLQDIEVLAIDMSLQTQTGEVARQADLVTLRATNMEQVLTLAAFSQEHTLRLVPRRADERKIHEGPGVIADLNQRRHQQPRAEPKEEEETKPAKPEPKPEIVKPDPGKPRGPGEDGRHTVRIDLGGEVREKTYKIKDKKDEDGNK